MGAEVAGGDVGARGERDPGLGRELENGRREGIGAARKRLHDVGFLWHRSSALAKEGRRKVWGDWRKNQNLAQSCMKRLGISTVSHLPSHKTTVCTGS